MSEDIIKAIEVNDLRFVKKYIDNFTDKYKFEVEARLNAIQNQTMDDYRLFNEKINSMLSGDVSVPFAENYTENGSLKNKLDEYERRISNIELPLEGYAEIIEVYERSTPITITKNKISRIGNMCMLDLDLSSGGFSRGIQIKIPEGFRPIFTKEESAYNKNYIYFVFSSAQPSGIVVIGPDVGYINKDTGFIENIQIGTTGARTFEFNNTFACQKCAWFIK